MNAADYRSFADDWERRATLRTRPRRMLENDDRLIYPASRQPLVLSATFLEHCSQWRDFVLVQSFYKFLNDVATGEGEGQREAILGNAASGLVDDLCFEDHHVIEEFVEALQQHEVAPLRAMLKEGRAQHQGLAARGVDESVVVFQHAPRTCAQGCTAFPVVGEGAID